MPKNWTITLTNSVAVTVKETSLAPTSSTIYSGPIGRTFITLAHNNAVYDSATCSYINIRFGDSTFKINYNGDIISPATGSNAIDVYITKLSRYMNGDGTVVF